MSRELTDILDAGEVDNNLKSAAERNKGVFSNSTDAGGGSEISNIVVISQQDYDNLSSVDPNTLYFITD